MKRHLVLAGKGLSGAGLTGVVLYLVATAPAHVHLFWPYWVFLGMVIVGAVLYLAGQEPAEGKADHTSEANRQDVASIRLRASLKRVWDSKRWRAATAVVVVLLVGAVIVPILLLSQPGSSAGPAAAQAAAVGTITSPHNGATDVPTGILHASGTVQHLQAGHHLWLFLEWKGVQTYWVGDSDVTVRNGRWSETIVIGAPGHVMLWLVDLGPGAYRVMNRDIFYQRNGFPRLYFAPGITRLSQIHFIAQ
jgi:hypothetical protein